MSARNRSLPGCCTPCSLQLPHQRIWVQPRCLGEWQGCAPLFGWRCRASRCILKTGAAARYSCQQGTARRHTCAAKTPSLSNTSLLQAEDKLILPPVYARVIGELEPTPDLQVHLHRLPYAKGCCTRCLLYHMGSVFV